MSQPSLGQSAAALWQHVPKAASGMRSFEMCMLTWALLDQMEQHLESLLSSASRVFYDQGSERMTHPCAPLKLRAAMHIALQQRQVEPLRSVIHPMR